MKWYSPATPDAMELFMEGAQAMARLEAAGMRVDTAYLDQAIRDTEAEIVRLEKSLDSSKEMKLWKKLHGEGTKLDSAVQLGRVIFKGMGHKRNPFLKDRETGKDPNNEAAFEHLKKDVPFLKAYFEVKKLRKALSTYLHGYRREVIDGYIHPHISLALAESNRSTCRNPNLQNVPVRNERISEIIRSCFIPRKGRVLIEADYGSQEVRVSQCYNQDPKLREYILGGGDMHKDLALRLYKLTEAELGDINVRPGKLTRYVAKNMFVFREFYGGVYFQAAPELWDAISLYGLQTAQGLSMFEHLARKGITGLGACDPDKDSIPGTFEHHVKEVERWMWEDNFTVYNQWKKDYWDAFKRTGRLLTKTGFGMYGNFRRNQVLCDAIQGSAFHCELWTVIKAQRELRKRKMKAKIINQIHDSILGDVPVGEVQDYCALLEEWGMKRVVQHWPWITIPLQMEFEKCEENWHKKKTFKWKEAV